MKFLVNWVDDRTGIRKILNEALFENIPGGARWRYVWGSVLTFAILIQFITGIALWMFYSPSTNTAWESVYYIQYEVTGGAWLRGIHHWTAQFMIVLLVLHLVQVIVDGAYKAPREFNFWFGLALMGITLALGLTGYLLPWDQKGFWATEVATNLLAGVPLIGDKLKLLVVGGSDYGHSTLTRFFALHAGVLPVSLILMIAVHIYLFRKHGITAAPPKTAASRRHFWWVALIVMGFAQAMLTWNWQYVPASMRYIAGGLFGICVLRTAWLEFRAKPHDEAQSKKPRRGDAYFWPDQILRDAIACAAVLGGILFFVWQFGTELSSPADPSEAYGAARPDWYFMALFYLLSLPGIDIIMGAFIIPGVIAFVVCLMPFLGRTRFGHGLNLVILVLLLAVFTVGTLAGFRHDWENPDFRVAVAAAERDAERIKELARAPSKIPPEGAMVLLRSDPYTQGPKLFATNCASCHAYDGHDGMGRPRKDEQIASDLYNFGDRAWVAAMLDPVQFAHIDKFGGTELIKDSKMLEFLEEDLSDLDEDDKADVAKMVKALSAEAKLKSQREMDLADAEDIEEGKELISDFGCTDCHIYYDEGSKGPDLTAYASREWQVEFIKNPEHKRFYGKRNDKMPVYGAKIDEEGNEILPAQLTDQEIGFIVDWLRGEWYEEEEESEVGGE